MAHVYSTFKRALIGRPLASAELGHQRLSKLVGLAVFSSDAVASTAFASEQILQVLVPAAGAMAIGYLVPISFIVVILLAVVVTSYRQTIFAYPGGGGSYIVSRENLGTHPALVAGASLLVDYTLNVAVSVAAGVAAITSAIAGLRGHQVGLALGLVALITVANLRGVKESGRLFAGPVYGYVAAMAALVVYGLYRSVFGHLARHPRQPGRPGSLHGRQGAGRWRDLVPADARLRLRCRCSFRGRGHLQRCAGVPQPGDPQRGGHPHVDRDHPGRPLLRHRPAGRTPPPDAVDLGDDPLRDGFGRVRPRQSCLCRAASHDRRDPGPFGQHQLRRLPAAVLDHRQRRVPAPPARKPRRPPRLLQRHHRLGPRLRRLARRIPR